VVPGRTPERALRVDRDQGARRRLRRVHRALQYQSSCSDARPRGVLLPRLRHLHCDRPADCQAQRRRSAGTGSDDHVCSVFPPGMGILALPFFCAVRPRGRESTRPRPSRTRRARRRRDRGNTRDARTLVGAPSVRDGTLVAHPCAPLFPRDERAYRPSQALWQHSGCTSPLRRRSGSSFGRGRPAVRDLAAGVCWGLARSCARRPPRGARLARFPSDTSPRDAGGSGHRHRPRSSPTTISRSVPHSSRATASRCSPRRSRPASTAFWLLHREASSSTRPIALRVPRLVRAWRWPGEVAGRLAGFHSPG